MPAGSSRPGPPTRSCCRRSIRTRRGCSTPSRPSRSGGVSSRRSRASFPIHSGCRQAASSSHAARTRGSAARPSPGSSRLDESIAPHAAGSRHPRKPSAGAPSRPRQRRPSPMSSVERPGGGHVAADATPSREEGRRATSGEDVLVEVTNLKKYFPIRGGFMRRTIGQVQAVDGVSLQIRRGETLGLVGESGCGKTTFGRTILRLEPATEGEVKFNGQDIYALGRDDLKKIRRRMQIIFQDPVASLNPRMPVSDIIGEGLLAQADDENGWRKRSVRDKRVGDMLEAVGLRREYTRRYPHEFSGGQRQRIGIARAIALDPEFIVCDEPVSALDVSIQSQILNLLVDLRERFNLTYLFVAHNLSVIEFISDRVGVMYLGKLVELADVA